MCVLPEHPSKNLDLFHQAQLATVLKTCYEAPTMAEAGRRLFSVSRQQLKSPNDSDRLRKYLLKFELTWRDVRKTKQVNPPPKEQAPPPPHFEPHTFQPAIRP
jgi:sigma54-dependent transcription regulator